MQDVFPVVPYLTKGQRRKFQSTDVAGIINEEEWYFHYMEKLMALRYTVFNWEGLPDYVPIEYIERVLLLTGRAAFIRDDKYGIQILSVAGVTDWDLYGQVTKFTVQPLPLEGGVVMSNYPTREFTSGVDAVIVRNDPDANNEMLTISMYARQLAKIRKQQAVNIDNQETTKIFAVDESTVLSMQDVDNQMRNGAKTIIRYKTKSDRVKDANGEIKERQPLWEYNTPADYVAGNLQELHDNIWSEALTSLGVNNVPVRKKERLVVSEAESNNDEVNMNSQLQFEMREQACEEIKRVIGIDVTVERNGMKLFSEQEDVAPESDETPKDEGGEEDV